MQFCLNIQKRRQGWEPSLPDSFVTLEFLLWTSKLQFGDNCSQTQGSQTWQRRARTSRKSYFVHPSWNTNRISVEKEQTSERKQASGSCTSLHFSRVALNFVNKHRRSSAVISGIHFTKLMINLCSQTPNRISQWLLSATLLLPSVRYRNTHVLGSNSWVSKCKDSASARVLRNFLSNS